MKELFITIPCEPASGPDRIGPVLIFLGVDSSGADRCVYECPYCHQRHPRRHPLSDHLGMNMNKPATCRVLKRQDEQRRTSSKQTTGGT